MKVNIITGFPQLISPFLDTAIVRRALSSKLLKIDIINLRDFAEDRHRTIDDYPYGGGPGMVLKANPLLNALDSIKNHGLVIYPSPQGITLSHTLAKELSSYKTLTIICGHYEGVDERVLEEHEPLEISIGDYVVSGGELPALIVLDTILRLMPDFISRESAESDSFYKGLLDNSAYTRPQEVRGVKVPEVLISGHHNLIERFRERERVLRTLIRRPDLIDELKEDDKKRVKALFKELCEKIMVGKK